MLGESARDYCYNIVDCPSRLELGSYFEPTISVSELHQKGPYSVKQRSSKITRKYIEAKNHCRMLHICVLYVVNERT